MKTMREKLIERAMHEWMMQPGSTVNWDPIIDAILDELREPDPGMVDVGCRYSRELDGLPGIRAIREERRREVVTDWQAMIDHARQDRSTPEG